jgi:hypothetical protein
MQIMMMISEGLRSTYSFRNAPSMEEFVLYLKGWTLSVGQIIHGRWRKAVVF